MKVTTSWLGAENKSTGEGGETKVTSRVGTEVGGKEITEKQTSEPLEGRERLMIGKGVEDAV